MQSSISYHWRMQWFHMWFRFQCFPELSQKSPMHSLVRLLIHYVRIYCYIPKLLAAQELWCLRSSRRISCLSWYTRHLHWSNQIRNRHNQRGDCKDCSPRLAFANCGHCIVKIYLLFYTKRNFDLKVLLWSNSRYPFFYIFQHKRCFLVILANFSLSLTLELMFFGPLFPTVYGRH